MILGLDISTAITGFAILDTDGSLIELGHIKLSDCSDLWEKADKVEAWIAEINMRYTLEHIFIEQSLQAFRPGMSSAATISLLTRFNGIVSYIVRKMTFITPTFIGATVARTKCGIKIKKDKQFGTGKQQVFNHVTTFMLHRTWPTGKTGKVKDYCYDEVDGYVIAEAGRRGLNS